MMKLNQAKRRDHLCYDFDWFRLYSRDEVFTLPPLS